MSPSVGVGDRLDNRTVPVDEIADIRVHGQVPDLGLAVLPAADQALAVWAECDGADAVGEAADDTIRCPVGASPDPDGRVVAPGSDRAAVGAEADCLNRPGMPRQQPAQLAVGQLPDYDPVL